MEKTLLFKRKFNGETYKFYMNKGVGCFGIYSEYVSVETPENDFGYTDTEWGASETLYLVLWVENGVWKEKWFQCLIYGFTNYHEQTNGSRQYL